MSERRKSRRLLERAKSLMILLLACSAVWLTLQMSGRLGSRTAAAESGTVLAGSRAEAARPLRLAACVQNGSETGRYGVQYDTQTSDALFSQVANLLNETLSSVGQPREVTQREWRTALTSAPGLYFDFQGRLPMSVLSGWLLGAQTELEGTVRRLLLSGAQGRVELYYCDERDGRYYACTSQVVNVSHLEEALSSLTDNGAVFAFESEQYRQLGPHTLLLPETPRPRVYTGANPLLDEEAAQTVQERLAFPQGSSVSYIGLGEQVIRNGNDTLRISASGVVTYSQFEGKSGRYPVPGGEKATLYQGVEACRQLAQDTLGTYCGAARLYLLDVQEQEGGWQVDFGYCLNGAQVGLDSEGYAARFLVERGEITQYTLRFRSYTDTGETSVVLPERQAMAAMEAVGHQGDELLLVYLDGGSSEPLTAVWAAAGTLQDGQGGR